MVSVSDPATAGTASSPASGSGPAAYIGRDEVESFCVREPWRAVFDGVAIWVVILGALWLWSVFPNPIVWLASACVIAARQHALNNMVHEASHLGLHPSRRWNDFLSDLFFAAPHLVSTAGYRSKHLLHHAHLGHPRRDTEIKNRYILTGKHFWPRIARIVCGGTLLETARSYGGSLTANRLVTLRHLALVALTNGALLVYCWSIGAPFAYLHLWLLPMLTLFPLLAALSVIAEHQTREYAAKQVEDYDASLEPGFTRSITAGPVERFFLAPGNFCYHMEHHAFPRVGYSQLPRLHRRLEALGYFERNPGQVASSFLGVFKVLFAAPRADDRG